MDRFAPPTAEDDPKVIGKCDRCRDDIYEGEPEFQCSCEQVVCECCVTTCGICNKKYCDDCIIPNWENTGIWVCKYCDESGAAQEKLLTETETSNDPAAQYVAALCREKIRELKVLTELHDIAEQWVNLPNLCRSS
jgi:hypothetical protein